MSGSPSPEVEGKLRHMIECLNEYASEVRQYNFESAHEAADAIGSEDGEGCTMCENLSSSLSAALAHAMWFPDEEEQQEIVTATADRAERYAEGLEGELNTS